MFRFQYLVPLLILAVAGCQNDPLVFAATQTFGVKISISPKQDEPVKLVMGYDSNDTTIMPTTMDKARGRIAAWTGGCTTKDDKSLECVDLPLPMDVGGTASVPPPTDAERELAEKAKDKLSAVPGKPRTEVLTVAELNALNKVEAAAAAAGHTEMSVGGTMVGITPGKGGRAYQYDALSVLSSFNADAKGEAGTQAAVGASLGKLFATGVAAQDISDGMQHKMADKWAPSSSVDCLQKLQEVLGAGKVDSATATAVCGTKAN